MLGISLLNRHDARVTTWITPVTEHLKNALGTADINLEIAPSIIAPGAYSLSVALFETGISIYHQLEAQCPFVIHDTGSPMAQFSNNDYGSVIIPARWSSAVPSIGFGEFS